MNNSDNRLKISNSVTIFGAVLNIVLSILKVTVGILGRSSAMVSDGLHSLSDLMSDLVVIVGAYFSSKPRDKNHNYGHGKIENLSAIVIGFILISIALMIGYKSTITGLDIIKGRDVESPMVITLLVALLSILLKEFLFRYTLKKGREIDSSVVIANAYHHRTDAYSSIATAIGIGGAIILGDRWVILDPFAGLVVSAIIVKEAISIIYMNINQLLEASLPEDINSRIIEISSGIPGVYKPHNLRSRRVGNLNVIDLHICIKPHITVKQGHDLVHKLQDKISLELKGETVFNIHTEPLTSISQAIYNPL